MRRSTYSLCFAMAATLMLLLSGCVGEAVEVEACKALNDADECSECCDEEGYVGHRYSDFSDPACRCRVAGD